MCKGWGVIGRGPAQSYAHPVEMLIGNVLPLLAQPLMLRTHILIAWLWLAVATAVTQACGLRVHVWCGLGEL